MDAFLLAWNAWLRLSVLGMFFCLVTWKRMPFFSVIYVVGGIILVLAKYSDPAIFGISESTWKNDPLYHDVRTWLIFGQLGLSAATIFIENNFLHTFGMSGQARTTTQKTPEADTSNKES